MTVSMSRATTNFRVLHEWAIAFNENVVIKYLEIVLLLFLKNFGALSQSKLWFSILHYHQSFYMLIIIFIIISYNTNIS